MDLDSIVEAISAMSGPELERAGDADAMIGPPQHPAAASIASGS